MGFHVGLSALSQPPTESHFTLIPLLHLRRNPQPPPQEDPHALPPRFADGILLARLVAGLLPPAGPDDDGDARRALEEVAAVDVDAEEDEAVAVVPRLKRIKLALGALRRLRGTGGGGGVAAALPLHLLHREIDVLEGRREAVVPLLLGIKRVYDARGAE